MNALIFIFVPGKQQKLARKAGAQMPPLSAVGNVTSPVVQQAAPAITKTQRVGGQFTLLSHTHSLSTRIIQLVTHFLFSCANQIDSVLFLHFICVPVVCISLSISFVSDV